MVTIGRGGGGSQQECPGFKSTGLLGPFGGNKGKKNWLKKPVYLWYNGGSLTLGLTH